MDATAWTSVEGTTIWARLEGWDGSRVLLGIQGQHYWVPLSRFAPKSAEKARRLLDLPPATASAAIAGSRPPPQDVPAQVPAHPQAALPAQSEPLEPTDEGYASVLPERDPPPPAERPAGHGVSVVGRQAIAPAGMRVKLRAYSL
ncbi:MAG: hypothetical protein NTW21_40645 [Verrucomicrobia bacterium]|nr:hypothetical protein [Verrucomicrobiota bacterium]